ncbi:MAG: NUDIX hydrolase [Candidatus Hydrogenedentes bacterium]|nr:NUDIX hydrolase [Candidatus Hydrogenedentota bacterium]
MYTYPYPRPMVTIDAVVFARVPSGPHVLLIQRAHAPFAGAWALPGGFVDMDEPLDAAAARELAEETGLRQVALRQFHTYGDPTRDPRGRTISIAHVATVEAATPVTAQDDAAAAQWFPLDALPPLAFDHATIIADALQCAHEDRTHGHH